MEKFLKHYYKIMDSYRNGELGEDHLSMGEILEKSNAKDIFNQMSLDELNNLIDSSSAMIRPMFKNAYNQRYINIKKMVDLEDSLGHYKIEQYCENGKLSDSKLEKELRLDVQYLEKSEMPKDVEATLSPSSDEKYYGVIKILKGSKTKFPYIHEIMHYLKDVGIGKKVEREYTRKVKGKTDSIAEQDINYLTAASVMPISKIETYLEDFERITGKEEEVFLRKMARQFEQDTDAVLRRFIEVRSLVSFGYKA